MEGMWIAGVAKENYVNYCSAYEESLSCRKGKQIVIFGAGIMGLQFCYTMESLGDIACVFCDNDKNKWGTEIAGKKVISPEELKENKEKYFVFLAMERYETCAKQLEKMGCQRGIDWVNLKNVSEQKLLEDFQKDNDASTIVLGDCAVNVVSIADASKLSLGEMLYKENSVKVLALNGLYMRAYYNVFLMCLEKMKKLKKLVLLLDASIFQEKFCYYSGNQHVLIMEQLKEVSQTENLEVFEFLEESRKRAEATNLLVHFSPNRTECLSADELERERKMHMRLNYLFPVRKETESFRYLELLAKICQIHSIELVSVIMPINNEMGEKYFGQTFYEKYEKIRDELTICIENNKGIVLDISYELKENDFICLRSTNEGMTAAGREKTVKLIAEKL